MIFTPSLLLYCYCYHHKTATRANVSITKFLSPPQKPIGPQLMLVFVFIFVFIFSVTITIKVYAVTNSKILSPLQKPIGPQLMPDVVSRQWLRSQLFSFDCSQCGTTHLSHSDKSHKKSSNEITHVHVEIKEMFISGKTVASLFSIKPCSSPYGQSSMGVSFFRVTN